MNLKDGPDRDIQRKLSGKGGYDQNAYSMCEKSQE